jgi:hypothetical protein
VNAFTFVVLLLLLLLKKKLDCAHTVKNTLALYSIVVVHSTTTVPAIPHDRRIMLFYFLFRPSFFFFWLTSSSPTKGSPASNFGETDNTHARDIVSAERRTRTWSKSENARDIVLQGNLEKETDPDASVQLYTGRSIPHKPIRLNVLVNFEADQWFPLDCKKRCIAILFLRLSFALFLPLALLALYYYTFTRETTFYPPSAARPDR